MSGKEKGMSRLCVGMCVAAAVLLVASPVAGAKVIDQQHYSGTEVFTDDECGFDLDVVSTFSGQFRLRVDKGGQAFYVKDTFSYRDVVTNPATGNSFVVRGHGVFNEVKATLIAGDVYEFTAIEAGQPFVIEDAAGNVVVRDRGVIRHTARFDTLGDGQPGAELIEGSESATVHGPHPGFADDFPFCEIAAELTAA
jgi:hypothetical protein